MLRIIRHQPHTHADAGWFRWKLHRVILKSSWHWRRLYSPLGLDLEVKYLAEGGVNYVFNIRNDRRLLRITKAQFYNLDYPMDGWTVSHNIHIRALLADAGLAPAGTHLFGGVTLVEHAGIPITRVALGAEVLAALARWFAEAAAWSRRTGIVLLDYNDGNWCWKDGRVTCVDVDSRFVCFLDSIREHPLVTRRLAGASCANDVEALDVFLAREKDLLIKELTRADKPGSRRTS